MRVLIDNCVPWRLGDAIVGHNVSSVVKLGLAGLDDGPLLDAMWWAISMCSSPWTRVFRFSSSWLDAQWRLLCCERGATT